MTELRRADLKHTPYFCEENAWHLCDHPFFQQVERRVLFISNPDRCCPFWHQRASSSQDQPLFWDYHVLLIAAHNARWMVWDLDTTLPFPSALSDYTTQTFGAPGLLRPEFAPVFRVVTPTQLKDNFSSDRSHMRAPDGAWQQQPPTWAPIFTAARGMNLMRFVDMGDPFVGKILTHSALLREFGGC